MIRALKKLIHSYPRLLRLRVRRALKPIFDRGARGEWYARIWLTRRYFLVWTKNWRTKFGEIDIVASSGRTLFFFEVKTRSKASAEFARPAAAVNPGKLRRLERLAAEYQRRHLGLVRRARIKRFQIVTIEIVEKPWRLPSISARSRITMFANF